MHGPSGGLRRIIRVGLVVVGAVLIGSSVLEVLQPLVDTRAALNPIAFATCFGGTMAVTLGFIWR